nr:MAG TPA: hypothetical protein [Caudoviricetes sp.]
MPTTYIMQSPILRGLGFSLPSLQKLVYTKFF